jgi:hypothetical protein
MVTTNQWKGMNLPEKTSMLRIDISLVTSPPTPLFRGNLVMSYLCDVYFIIGVFVGIARTF